MHSPCPYPVHMPDLRPPAIQEGWPHHSQEADPLRGFPSPGLLALWRGYTPVKQLPSTASSLEELCSPEMPEQALPSHGKSASIAGWACHFRLP